MTRHGLTARSAARVEAATEANREVDAECAAALRILPDIPGTDWLKGWAGPFVSHGEGRVAAVGANGAIAGHWAAPHLTSDPSAALREIERRWPDREWKLHKRVREDGSAGYLGWIAGLPMNSIAHNPACAATAALLMLTARSAADV